MQRLWARGDLLRDVLNGASEPRELPLDRPDSRALSERFDDVRAWIRALEDGSKTSRGFGYEIAWREINHRVIGPNRVPARITVPTTEDALHLAGARRDAAQFAQAAAKTLSQFPDLRNWIARRPLLLLEHAGDLDGILRVLAWFRSNPVPRVYLRQVDIPGVDSKFIEERKGLLSELLSVVLPSEAIDDSFRGARFFEQRYGLLAKPALIRFRVIDPAQSIGGFYDLTVTASEFSRAGLDVDRIFVTENDANGLAFPSLSRSIVIFGLGYGVESLAPSGWLASRKLYYWGDIDTHGFAMLDRMRRLFPHTISLLMDRKTLLQHHHLWTHEQSQYLLPLERLSTEEHLLYDDLREGRLGNGVRLEQERISFGCVERALAEIEEQPTLNFIEGGSASI